MIITAPRSERFLVCLACAHIPHVHRTLIPRSAHHAVESERKTKREMPDESCDRRLSRAARKVVRDVVRPLAETLGVEVSPHCPLHADNDFLWAHERHKRADSQRQWRCGLCGKIFKAEHYLDRHLERRHEDELNATQTACLADYCDILQCPSWIEGVRRQERQGLRRCKPEEHLARQHFCQHLVHDCFASASGADLHRAFERLQAEFCSPISCAGRQRLARDGSTLGSPSRLSPPAGGALGAPPTGGMYYVVCTVLFAALAVLYISLACVYSEARTADATANRPGRRPRATTSWWGSWWGWRGAAAGGAGKRHKEL